MQDEVEVAFAGVAAQAELLRRRELSSRELVELCLGRIARIDRQLNCFARVFEEQALAEADAADRLLANGESAALLGVPVAVKDEIDIAGEVTSHGTGAMVAKATADAEVVRRLRGAGAVVIGKTNMPEFGLWPFTESQTWGVTRNPWDPRRTPGGSSGGSAAAVAAGLVPAALSADGAGSIRIPAACCGLFGLKPSRGRVPRAPHDRDGVHWVVFGALARGVADTGLMLEVLGDDVAPTPGEPGRLRVAVVRDFPLGTRGELDAEVAGALDESAQLLRELGHEVVEERIDMRPRDVPVVLGMMFRIIREVVASAELPQRLEPRTRAMARPGRFVGGAMKERLLAAEQAMVIRIASLFAGYDVVLAPMMAQPPPAAGLMERRGALATYMWESGWVPFTILWNITGQPAASVPAGFSSDGLPLAVQLVGRPRAEATLLALAAEIERERPWPQRPALADGHSSG